MSGKVKLFFSSILLVAAATALAQDPGATDTVLAFNANAAIDEVDGGKVRIEIIIRTDNTGPGNDITGISIPLRITNSNPASAPVLDTTEVTTFGNSAVANFDVVANSVQGGTPSVFPLRTVLGAYKQDSPGLTAGEHLLATLVVSLSDTTTICLDTFLTDTFNLSLVTSDAVSYAPFWQLYCVPVKTYPHGEPPMFVVAHSPVNLIVIDPNNDSIGVNFNTISLDSAFYNVANDSISIYKTFPGNYKIKAVLDTLDQSGETTYTVEARMDGTADHIIVASSPLPDTGQPDEVTITNDPNQLGCLAIPADVNSTGGAPNLQDVLYLVNFIFDKGRAATGCVSTNPTTCYPVVPICRGDVNGSGGPPNLTDVIYLVNFIFDKDRAATGCLGTNPVNCWIPVSSEACCMAVP